MITALVSAALLVATPTANPNGESFAEDRPAPTYQKALRCTFIFMSYGMTLSGDEEEEKRARGSALLGMVEPFLDYAGELSGKDQQEVIDDLGAMAGDIGDAIRASDDPVAMVDAEAAECEALASAM